MDMRLESISIPSPDPQVKATGGGMNMFPRRGSGMNGGIVPNTMVIDTIVRDSTTSQIIFVDCWVGQAGQQLAGH